MGPSWPAELWPSCHDCCKSRLQGLVILCRVDMPLGAFCCRWAERCLDLRECSITVIGFHAHDVARIPCPHRAVRPNLRALTPNDDQGFRQREVVIRLEIAEEVHLPGYGNYLSTPIPGHGALRFCASKLPRHNRDHLVRPLLTKLSCHLLCHSDVGHGLRQILGHLLLVRVDRICEIVHARKSGRCRRWRPAHAPRWSDGL